MELLKSFYAAASDTFDSKNVEKAICNLCGSNAYETLGVERFFRVRALVALGIERET